MKTAPLSHPLPAFSVLSFKIVCLFVCRQVAYKSHLPGHILHVCYVHNYDRAYHLDGTEVSPSINAIHFRNMLHWTHKEHPFVYYTTMDPFAVEHAIRIPPRSDVLSFRWCWCATVIPPHFAAPGGVTSTGQYASRTYHQPDVCMHLMLLCVCVWTQILYLARIRYIHISIYICLAATQKRTMSRSAIHRQWSVGIAFIM